MLDNIFDLIYKDIMKMYKIYKALREKQKPWTYAKIGRFFGVTHQAVRKSVNKTHLTEKKTDRTEYFQKYYIANRERKRSYFREQHKKRVALKLSL